MTIPVNPKTANWINPTQATDQTGALVAWDASTDMAGIEIQFDGTPAVSVPTGFGTSFDLTTLAAYKALPAGSHNLDMAVVTKEGAVGQFSSTQPFQVAVVPLAPTAVVLA
jgi:hypothetical protein